MQDHSASVVMVTGAASGIGTACAAELVACGARVALLDVAREAGERTAAGLATGRAIFVAADVSRADDWQAAFDAAEAQLGPVTGLVNCAAIASDDDVLDLVDEATWNRILEVNLTGVMLGCQTFLQRTDLQGHGAIVNFASIQGSVGMGDALAYAAAKGGVRMLTKSVAQHCMAEGYTVRCNAVSPGYIDTPMVAPMFRAGSEDADRAQLAARHPIGRLGQPAEVAKAVAFLLSADADFVNGSDYAIDGGYLAV